MGHMSRQRRGQACDSTRLLTVEGGPCKDCKREGGSRKKASGVPGERAEDSEEEMNIRTEGGSRGSFQTGVSGLERRLCSRGCLLLFRSPGPSPGKLTIMCRSSSGTLAVPLVL